MAAERVELSASAMSYDIEIDVRDLEGDESLDARYKRYSNSESPRPKSATTEMTTEPLIIKN